MFPGVEVWLWSKVGVVLGAVVGVVASDVVVAGGVPPQETINNTTRKNAVIINNNLLIFTATSFYLRLIHPPRQYSVVINYELNLFPDRCVVNRVVDKLANYVVFYV